jgi:CDP-diacylglycerol--glycerol-3-phosphate 3-phosphatidyltransferase
VWLGRGDRRGQRGVTVSGALGRAIRDDDLGETRAAHVGDARRLIAFTGAGVATVLAVGLAAAPSNPVFFAALALGTLLAETVELARLLARAERRELGAATLLTLARGLALAALAGLATVPTRSGAAAWLPAILYGFNAVSDGLDGWLARTRGTTSVLGARLDTAFDALGMLVGPVVAVAHGRLPAFYLAVGVTYYVMVGAIGLRRALGLPVHPERNVPSARRRLFAGLHMALITAALVPATSPQVAAVVAGVFAPPLVLDLAVTIPVTLGWLQPATYRRLTEVATRVAFIALPLAARALAVPAALLADGMPAAARLLAAATVLGFGARTCAAAALVVVAASPPRQPDAAGAVLLVAAALVTYLGSGPLSPMRAEDHLLLTRAGERS